MSMQDSYVDRRSKGQVFATPTTGDNAIARALAAKANAVRRLERQGRRAKFNSGGGARKSTWAA